MIKYEHFVSFDSSDSKLIDNLEWLSKVTETQKKMLKRTVSFYLKNLLYVVFAFDIETIIGAACVIRCLDNQTGEEMYQGSRLVVELGSNYVDLKYRGQGIAKEFINKRLYDSSLKNYFPVCVTSNTTIKNYFKEKGGVLMDSYPEYNNLYSRIRSCNCSKGQVTHGVNCSFFDKDVWMFKNSM